MYCQRILPLVALAVMTGAPEGQVPVRVSPLRVPSTTPAASGFITVWKVLRDAVPILAAVLAVPAVVAKSEVEAWPTTSVGAFLAISLSACFLAMDLIWPLVMPPA